MACKSLRGCFPGRKLPPLGPALQDLREEEELNQAAFIPSAFFGFVFFFHLNLKTEKPRLVSSAPEKLLEAPCARVARPTLQGPVPGLSWGQGGKVCDR